MHRAAQLSGMADPSPLEQLRRKLALAVGENAVFDGWTRQAVDSAARQLGTVWHRLRKQATLTVEVKSLKDQLRLERELVGESTALSRVESQIRRVAETKATVLIRGESGVGKELVARAIHDAIHQGMKARGILPRRVEGLTESRWILMDYLDVVVHVFTPDTREYYRLEQLWGEAPSLAVGVA